MREHPRLNLISEDGGFLYDSDTYNEDLPYWTAAELVGCCASENLRGAWFTSARLVTSVRRRTAAAPLGRH